VQNLASMVGYTTTERCFAVESKKSRNFGLTATDCLSNFSLCQPSSRAGSHGVHE
jgi:hypothetical protein